MYIYIYIYVYVYIYTCNKRSRPTPSQMIVVSSPPLHFDQLDSDARPSRARHYAHIYIYIYIYIHTYIHTHIHIQISIYVLYVLCLFAHCYCISQPVAPRRSTWRGSLGSGQESESAAQANTDEGHRCDSMTCVYIHMYTQTKALIRHAATPGSPAIVVDFGGFDPSAILILRGGIPRPMGDLPESLSQAMLIGIMLVGRLGVYRCMSYYIYRCDSMMSWDVLVVLYMAACQTMFALRVPFLGSRSIVRCCADRWGGDPLFI